jgi:hypothetical protein
MAGQARSWVGRSNASVSCLGARSRETVLRLLNGVGAGSRSRRPAYVKRREKAVGIIEKSSFGDGLYKVGADIKAGTYRTTGGSGCYRARLSSSDTYDITDNHFGNGPQTLVINSAWFESQGCGTWVLSA